MYPAKGVRVDKIASYERDIARATRAERINILAPIPGKDTVGIEIANSKKQKVTLREMLESDEFQNAKGRIHNVATHVAQSPRTEVPPTAPVKR